MTNKLNILNTNNTKVFTKKTKDTNLPPPAPSKGGEYSCIRGNNFQFSIFNFQFIVLLFSAFCFLPSAFSQEEVINQDVQVVREYNPAISDAFKINDMPSATDTLKSSPVFRYQLKGKALIAPPEMVPMTPARLAKEPLDELYPAYARAYVGYYQIVGGQLVYNLVRNENYALVLNVSHESSFGDINLENKQDAKADYHDTHAGLYMKRFLQKSVFSLDMDFNNFAYRYYGLSTINQDMFYYPYNLQINTDEMKNQVYSDRLLSQSRQRQTVFDINMRLKNNALKDYTKYDVLLGFYTFQNHNDANETSFRYNGDFDFELNDFTIRLETGVDFAGERVNYTKEYPSLYQYQDRSQTLIQINPAFLKRHNNFLIKIGLRIGAGFDTMEDEFYLSPDIAVNYAVDNAVKIEAGITGDIKQNSYRTIMEENPFISPDLTVKPAFHEIKFFAGVSGNFNSKTSFGAKVEYGTFRNEHFYVNKMYYPDMIYSNFSVVYDNKFGVQYDDGRLLTISGEIKANISKDFDLLLRAAYLGWQTDTLEKAWHKPNMELGVRAIYKATRDLHFSAAFNVLGERFAMAPPENNNLIKLNDFTIKTLKPVYDFNLGVNYIMNSRLHFFATVQNIFVSKYYMYNGYPMHGINARAGVGFSF